MLIKFVEQYVTDACGLGKYVLDIGTGSANMALALAEKKIRCITIEKNIRAYKEAVRIIRESNVIDKPMLLNMDARKMTFLDNTFDYVIAYKSMHHIKQAEIAIEEMIRVCKPGGKIIIIEHGKNIRAAIDLISVSRGEVHPKCIDMDIITDILKEKEGHLSNYNSKIGRICVFVKNGVKKEYVLEEKSDCVKLGRIGDTEYMFNCMTREFSYTRAGEMGTILIIKKTNDVKPVRSICLNLANQCNLNCLYCYANGGNYGHVEAKMQAEVAKKGIEWFQNKAEQSIHIILFGGEPLLNRETIAAILSYNCKGKSYSINTNAILLDETILNMLVENNVKISISIDGSARTHDAQRVFKDGRGTYDIISDKLAKIPTSIMRKLWARITVTKNTESIFREIIALLDMGFIHIDMSFVSGNIFFSEDDRVVSLWKEDINRLSELALTKWLDDEIFIYPFVKVFQSALYGRHALDTCTAGREMISLQPDQTLVPCFKFSDYVLGSLDDGVENEKVYEFEYYKKIERNLVCSGCWVYEFCGGLCPKDFETVINIQNKRCDLIQYLVKCSLRHLCSLYNSSPEKFRKKEEQNKMRQWIQSVRGENG